MGMRAGALGFLTMLGCSASDVYPGTTRPDAETLGESAVAALGVAEVTTGDVPGAEQTTRSVTALVAVCLRSHLRREPWSRGTLGFHFRAEEPRKLSTTGEYSSQPVASCIGAALAKAVIAPGAVGTIDYMLTFHGNYADQYAVEGTLDVRHVLVDSSSPDSVPPAAAAADLARVQKQLEFCAFGAEPRLAGAYFAAIDVSREHSIVVVAPDQKDTEAGDCMTRALGDVQFTHLGTDYVVGLVATPGRPSAAAARELDAPAADRADLAKRAPIRIPRPAPTQPAPPRRPPPPPILVSGGVVGPQVKLGPASNLSVDRAAIVQRAVVGRRESIRACYRRGLEDDARLKGTLLAEFDVATNGALSNLKVGSELGTQTSVCVGNVLAGLTVATQGANFAVRYPIEFFLGSTPPEEVVADVATLQTKPVADASMKDLGSQLQGRQLDFLAVPNSSAPSVLVFLAGENVLGAFFASAGAGSNPEVCQSGTSGRVLVVRGRSCASVLTRILD